MKIIDPSAHVIDEIDGQEVLKKVERIGRVCYKSEERITDDSAGKFIARLLESGHESVIEHVSVSVKVICDRGVTHEIVRHRIASYSQESTRYCNYANDRFGNELTFIRPFYFEEGSEKYKLWHTAMADCEKSYLELIQSGATPQEARAILPNSLKTELVMTMNLRQWRHFFRLRLSKYAHPQMQQTARQIYDALKSRLPVIFDDLRID